MPTVTDIARESYDFWRPLVRLPVHAFALVGNEDGETSFRPHAVGDRGEAFGPFQWHEARVEGMLRGCGIDVRIAPHRDQLRAAHWEMTAGSYRKVWPVLMAANTLWSAVTELVRAYEGSANQTADIRKRVGFAQHWQQVFGS